MGTRAWRRSSGQINNFSKTKSYVETGEFVVLESSDAAAGIASSVARACADGVRLYVMDPTTLAALIATFLLQHPAGALEAASERTKAVPTDVAIALQTSFAELSKAIVLCYHESARSPLGEVVQRPWKRQEQYGADDSALIRIKFLGALTGLQYEMRVAVLAKNESKQIRTAVQADSAPFNPNRHCPLDRWIDRGSS